MECTDINLTSANPGYFYTDKNQKKLYGEITYEIPSDKFEQSEANEDASVNLEEAKKTGGLMTPSDYYSVNIDTTKVEQGNVAYTKAEDSLNTIKNKWFWVDEIKNWCIWRKVSDYYIHLYVWNGRNDWDKFEDIINALQANDLQTLKRKYLYNPQVFTLGPYIEGIKSTYTTYYYYNNTVVSTYISKQDGIGYHSYFSLVLKRDTNMSTYDSETFQNIHSSNIKYIEDTGIIKQTSIPPGLKFNKNEPYGAIVQPTVGCPCVIKSTNGQLNLMYVFRIDGNYTVKDTSNNQSFYQEDSIKYLNSVCKTYFGAGDEKTIDDWKNFNKIDTTEEQATLMYSSDVESLYGASPVVNSVAETINMNIEITAPRPNVTTTSVENPDYILRWDRQ